MRRLECDVCLQDIDDYYDTNVSIIDHHQRLLAMAADSPHGSKLLSSGRVVILRDGVSKRRLVKKIYRTDRKRLTEFSPPFHSISNPMSGCCSNLRRHRLP